MVRPLRAGEFSLCFFLNLFFLLLDSMGKGIHHVIGGAIVRKKKNWPVQSRPCTAVIYLESAIKKLAGAKRQFQFLK